MKTKEELNALKEEVETVSKKLHKLTEEELAQVTGGIAGSTKGGNAKEDCEALQGKAAGSQVVSTTGEPGTEMYIRVRGAQMLSGAGESDPLVIVD